MNKLWLLKAIDESAVPYDGYDSFVVRAPHEESARFAAQEKGADECYDGSQIDGKTPFWTDPTKTTCEELTAEGVAGVVLGSFNAG